MGARDFVRSLRPGNDKALAAELHQKAKARREEDVKLISDRDSGARRRRSRRARTGPTGTSGAASNLPHPASTPDQMTGPDRLPPHKRCGPPFLTTHRAQGAQQ
ncbi:hypothetical protein E4K10_30255 [Streptomyces sp. T1317-0309]|nr:hypothetical protein E4K10_30255 [Streptomyces sp. T1317-0309]